MSAPHISRTKERIDDGKIQTPAAHHGGGASLLCRAIRREQTPVGQMVTVLGFAAKNGSHTANARDVILADGKRLFAGSSGTGAPYDQK